MKKKILSLSLILALAVAMVVAISMPVFATSTDTTNQEVACTHSSTSMQITKKASNNTDGNINYVCNSCKEIVSQETIPMVNVSGISALTYYSGYATTPTVNLYDASGNTLSSSNYSFTLKKDGKTVKNVKDAGQYSITFTLKGNKYEGTINRSFTVKPKTLKKTDLYIPNVTYTGKKTKPTIRYYGTKLKEGRDYTITKISNNKKYGKASVTIKFKGNYSGTVKTTYTISTATVKNIKLKKRSTSSITISWSKVKNATGYKIYRYDYKKEAYKLCKTTSSTSAEVKRINSTYDYIDMYVVAYKKVGKKSYNSNETYYYNCVKPNTVKYSLSSTKGQIKVKYSSLKSYRNVQVQVSTNKAFNKKKAKVQTIEDWVTNSSKYNNIKVPNLKSGKTYYVRSRGYTTDRDGKRVYGNWGTVKQIKVK